MAELTRVTNPNHFTSAGSGLNTGSSADRLIEAFNAHDDLIAAARLAIIGMYQAEGLSYGDALAKFNELNPELSPDL